jgi:hypothetical protein
MPSRSELMKISKTRLMEIKVLNRHRFYDGAKYLSGYVVETALKARICKILDGVYPESGEISKSFLTHKFDILVKLGGLEKQLDNELNSNINFKTNWSIATSWTETYRYKAIGTSSKQEITDLLIALEDKNDGVLTWIRKRW